MNVGLIVALSVVGGVVIILLAIFLYFFVFARNRLRRQAGEYVRRYEYLHGLIFGQDDQFVKRLEMIARTNLLYVDIHMRFNKRYREVRDIDDANMTGAINRMKDFLNDRNFKELKSYLPTVREQLAAYDGRVNSLNSDLMQVIRPEEECREASMRLKEQLRRIKNDYYSKQSDMSMMVGSFETAFNKLEKEFTKFETLVESAQYQEAQEILPSIGAVINELEKQLQTLPSICLTIQTVLPDKLSSLKARFEEMQRQGYPLLHLMNKEHINEMREQLARLSKRVQRFDTMGVQNELDGISARIDDLFESFDKERDSRDIFERDIDTVFKSDSQVDKKFIKLCNALPNIKRVFVISSDDQARLDAIKVQINQMGATKRSLDSLIHSGNANPFSLLLERMNKLDREVKDAQAALDDFENYLMSLKTDSEAALNIVKAYFSNAKKEEKKLRDIAIEATTHRYEKDFDALYALLDRCYRCLKSAPIDVSSVNTVVAKIKGSGDELFQSLDRDYQQMSLAEQAMQYANRDRPNFGEIDNAITQCEGLFFSGEFQKAYEDAMKCLQAHLQE